MEPFRNESNSRGSADHPGLAQEVRFRRRDRFPVSEPRSDQGERRRLSIEAVEILLAIKRQQPKLSVRLVIKQARQTAGMPEDERLPETTVYRLLRDEGLMTRQPAAAHQDRRKFQFTYAGEMWLSDVLHGPRVPDDQGRRRKTYLIALLDDAIRLIPHAEFY